MISSVWSNVGISFCITIEVRWNVSFCFLYVHFSSNILRCIFLEQKKWAKIKRLDSSETPTGEIPFRNNTKKANNDFCICNKHAKVSINQIWEAILIKTFSGPTKSSKYMRSTSNTHSYLLVCMYVVMIWRNVWFLNLWRCNFCRGSTHDFTFPTRHDLWRCHFCRGSTHDFTFPTRQPYQLIDKLSRFLSPMLPPYLSIFVVYALQSFLLFLWYVRKIIEI